MQGNLQDDLHLRRNLLRAVCAPLSWKVVLIFSEVQKYNWHMDLINNHIFGLMLLVSYIPWRKYCLGSDQTKSPELFYSIM